MNYMLADINLCHHLSLITDNRSLITDYFFAFLNASTNSIVLSTVIFS